MSVRPSHTHTYGKWSWSQLQLTKQKYYVRNYQNSTLCQFSLLNIAVQAHSVTFYINEIRKKAVRTQTRSSAFILPWDEVLCQSNTSQLSDGEPKWTQTLHMSPCSRWVPHPRAGSLRQCRAHCHASCVGAAWGHNVIRMSVPRKAAIDPFYMSGMRAVSWRSPRVKYFCLVKGMLDWTKNLNR